MLFVASNAYVSFVVFGTFLGVKMDIRKLINGVDGAGLWHGTRTDIGVEGLIAGESLLKKAKPIVQSIYEKICASRGRSLQSIESYNVNELFTSPAAQDKMIDLGNSVRLIHQKFRYDVVAFATMRFAAQGYANDGSELARALCALIEVSRNEYERLFPEDASDPESKEIAQVHANAQALLNGEPKLYRLTDVPAQGKFVIEGRHGFIDLTAYELPFEGYPMPTEIFFTGSVPSSCLSLE